MRRMQEISGRRWTGIFLCFASIALLTGAAAGGVVLSPGQSATFDSQGFVALSGAPVARVVQPYSVGGIDGEYETAVFRDEITDHLTFLYRFSSGSPDYSRLEISFYTYDQPADVGAFTTSTSSPLVAIDFSQDQIFHAISEGGGITLMVTTEATEYRFGDLLAGFVTAGAQVDKETFAPALAIPLPPAFPATVLSAVAVACVWASRRLINCARR